MRTLAKGYNIFIWIGKILQPFLLLALRLLFGWQFFQHGIDKITNITPVIELFTNNGIANPALMAHLVSWVETIGGILLFLGLLTRAVAIPLAAVMLGALSTVHLKASEGLLSDPSTFLSQAPVPYLIAALVLLAFGPGLFSLDALFKRSLTDEK